MVLLLELGHMFLLKEGVVLTSLLDSFKVTVFSILDLQSYFFLISIKNGNKHKVSKQIKQKPITIEDSRNTSKKKEC